MGVLENLEGKGQEQSDWLSDLHERVELQKQQEQAERIENAYYFDLKTQDGTSYGKISQYGYDAIINHTLDTYTPLNDDETYTIEAFKKNVINKYGKFEVTGDTGGITAELCTIPAHIYFEQALNYWYYPVILILLILVIMQMIINRKRNRKKTE